MNLYARKSYTASNWRCKESVISLFILWTTGLACGLYIIAISGQAFLEPFQWAPGCTPSFGGLLLISLLPILVSVIAVYCSAPILIYIACFFKAVSFGTCLFGIIAVYGQSGWLVRSALLFSDGIISVLSIWLWSRCLDSNRFSIPKDSLFATVAAVTLCLIDYFMISPYLAFLMNY